MRSGFEIGGLAFLRCHRQDKKNSTGMGTGSEEALMPRICGGAAGRVLNRWTGFNFKPDKISQETQQVLSIRTESKALLTYHCHLL